MKCVGTCFQIPPALCNISRDVVAYSSLCGNGKGMKIAYDTDVKHTA